MAWRHGITEQLMLRKGYDVRAGQEGKPCTNRLHHTTTLEFCFQSSHLCKRCDRATCFHYLQSHMRLSNSARKTIMRAPAPPSFSLFGAFASHDFRYPAWRAWMCVPCVLVWCEGRTVTGISITTIALSISLLLFFQRDLSSLELTISFLFYSFFFFLIPLLTNRAWCS